MAKTTTVKAVKWVVPPNKLEFSEDFKESLQYMRKFMASAMTKLAKPIKSQYEYGTCNTAYNLRFISPENISTYISNLCNAASKNLITLNTSDLDKFNVESIRRFIKGNEGVDIEDFTVNSTAAGFVNPNSQTLTDLITFVETELHKASVYSAWEIQKRKEIVKEDLKKFSSMNFHTAIQSLVTAIPGILAKNECLGEFSDTNLRVLADSIEQMILFACTLNCLTLGQMILYAHPRSTFTKQHSPTHNELRRSDEPFMEMDMSIEGESYKDAPVKEEIVFEYEMLKTNNMQLQNRLPFECNMRSVVLQDVTPDFKDTKDAIVFIMTDERSPIRQLILQFGDEECRGDILNTRDSFPNIDCVRSQKIAKMFVGQVDDGYKGQSSQYKNDFESMTNTIDQTSMDKAGFRTDVSWLDTIAWGNNFLDHNHRRDQMGNENRNPITNTLNSIYRIYGSDKLETNEELANNICAIAKNMCAIITAYPREGIMNWHLVQDILAVFGEIMTRNMLKLYWNNNQMIIYSDNMADTMIPAFMYKESYELEDFSSFIVEMMVMEADKTPSVTMGKQAGQQGDNKPKVGFLQLLRRFGQWIVQRLAAVGINFTKAHAPEVNWVRKNTVLNDQIGQAIRAGTFTPTLNNAPVYNLKAGDFVNAATKARDEIIGLLESNEPIDPNVIINNILPNLGISAGDLEDPKKMINSVLYGQTEPQVFQGGSGILTGDEGAKYWSDLVSNITDAAKALELMTKNSADAFKQLTARLEAQHKQESSDYQLKLGEDFVQEALEGDDAVIKHAETQEGSEKNLDHLKQAGDDIRKEEAKNTKARTEEAFKLTRKLMDSFFAPVINAVGRQFYVSNYKIYRDIVNAYNQNKPAKAAAPTTEASAATQ